MASALFETAAAVAVDSVLLVSLLSSLSGTAQLASAIATLERQFDDCRRVAALLHDAASHDATLFVEAASGSRVVLTADRDSDGMIDGRSSERMTFEVRRRGTDTALLHAVGRQYATLVSGLPFGRAIEWSRAYRTTGAHKLTVPCGNEAVAVAMRSGGFS